MKDTFIAVVVIYCMVELAICVYGVSVALRCLD